MSGTPAQQQTYVLSAPPPVRALAIASVAALLGAVLVVLSATTGLPGLVLVVGVVLLLAGLALAIAGLVLTARLKTTVSLDSDGLHLSRGTARTELPWREITGVDLTANHILVRTSTADGAQILNPRGPSDPSVRRLMNAVREALDADRGYQNLPPG